MSIYAWNLTTELPLSILMCVIEKGQSYMNSTQLKKTDTEMWIKKIEMWNFNLKIKIRKIEMDHKFEVIWIERIDILGFNNNRIERKNQKHNLLMVKGACQNVTSYETNWQKLEKIESNVLE